MTPEDEQVVKQDTFVEFKSRLGNTIVHPSQWTTEDKGDAFSLVSSDGQAIINVLTFSVEGSGTLTDFQKLMTTSIEGEWIDSEWMDIDLGGINAKKRHLNSTDPSPPTSWCVYVLRNGECYHAILLNASLLSMEMNGGFYENLIRTFKGISSI